MRLANGVMAVSCQIDVELQYQETDLAPRLKEWASWVKTGGLFKKQHWSTLTALLPPDSVPYIALNHNHAFEIERIVSQLPARHRDAIRLHYVWDRRYTRDQKARIVGVGKSRFYQIVHQAELMVKNNLTRVDKHGKNTPQFI